MKLSDLNPRWKQVGNEKHLVFECPKHCDPVQGFSHSFVIPVEGTHKWDVTGDTFEDISLTPSIQDVGRCGWHGFVTNGEIISI